MKALLLKHKYASLVIFIQVVNLIFAFTPQCLQSTCHQKLSLEFYKTNKIEFTTEKLCFAQPDSVSLCTEDIFISTDSKSSFNFTYHFSPLIQKVVQKNGNLLQLPIENYFYENDQQKTSTKDLYVLASKDTAIICLGANSYPDIESLPTKDNIDLTNHLKGYILIHNLTKNNEGLYKCRSSKEMYHLHVYDDLQIEQGKQDLKDTLKCSISSKLELYPRWIRYGRQVETNLVRSLQDNGTHSISVIEINANPMMDDLYKCIITDTSRNIFSSKDIRIASKSLNKPFIMFENYNLNRTSRYLPGKKETNSTQAFLPKPQVEAIADNLALTLIWKTVRNRVDLRYVQIEYKITSRRKPFDLLEDLDGVELLIDNLPKRLDEWHILNSSNGIGLYFVNEPWLRPGYSYRFRVVIGAGSDVVSKWSDEISFAHIVDIKPEFKEYSRSFNGNINIAWSMNNQHIRKYFNSYVILYRPLHNDSAVQLAKHAIISINQNSFVLQNTNASLSYQVVVFATSQTAYNPMKKYKPGQFITMLSDYIRVTRIKGSLFNYLSSKQLMFIIFGLLVGLMALVLVTLCVICLCRRRKSGQDRNKAKRRQYLCCYRKERNKLNESGYTQNDYSVHQTGLPLNNQQRSFLLSQMDYFQNKDLPANEDQILMKKYRDMNHSQPPAPNSPAPPPPPPFEGIYNGHNPINNQDLYREYLRLTNSYQLKNSTPSNMPNDFSYREDFQNQSMCNSMYNMDKNGRVQSFHLPSGLHSGPINSTMHMSLIYPNCVENPMNSLSQMQLYNKKHFNPPSYNPQCNVGLASSINGPTTNNIVYVDSNMIMNSGVSPHDKYNLQKMSANFGNSMILTQSPYQSGHNNGQGIGSQSNLSVRSHSQHLHSHNPPVQQYKIIETTPVDQFYSSRMNRFQNPINEAQDEESMYNFNSGSIHHSPNFNSHRLHGQKLSSEENSQAVLANNDPYGQHNPTALLGDACFPIEDGSGIGRGSEKNSNPDYSSLTRKSSTNLLNEPPKVRDYSEYRILKIGDGEKKKTKSKKIIPEYLKNSCDTAICEENEAKDFKTPK